MHNIVYKPHSHGENLRKKIQMNGHQCNGEGKRWLVWRWTKWHFQISDIYRTILYIFYTVCSIVLSRLTDNKQLELQFIIKRHLSCLGHLISINGKEREDWPRPPALISNIDWQILRRLVEGQERRGLRERRGGVWERPPETSVKV